MPPLVTLIIPSHNAAPWLARTLESALAQTWDPCEVIVVDDGSTDGGLAIARSFEPRGVRVIAQPNRGASAARNAGLRAARGAFIQFLDADDLLAPDKVAVQAARAAVSPPGAILSGAWRRFVREPGDLPPVPEALDRDRQPVDWVVEKFERHAMVHPAAWLVPRALAERAGPWDETLSLDDDGEYFTRAVLLSDGVSHCPGALSWYRSGLPGSLSRARSEAAWLSAFRSLDLSARRLLQAEDSPRTRHAGATAYQRYAYEAYPRARACRRQARDEARRLGGSEVPLPGGPRLRLLRRLVGWRLARRLALLLG